eukprot:g59572.t1
MDKQTMQEDSKLASRTRKTPQRNSLKKEKAALALDFFLDSSAFLPPCHTLQSHKPFYSTANELSHSTPLCCKSLEYSLVTRNFVFFSSVLSCLVQCRKKWSCWSVYVLRVCILQENACLTICYKKIILACVVKGAMASQFTDFSSPAGLGKLNGVLSKRSYLVGYGPTQDDLTVLANLPRFVDPQRYPHIVRWANHISSFSPAQQATFPGKFVQPAAAPAPAKQEKQQKKEQDKPQQQKKEEKKPEPKKEVAKKPEPAKAPEPKKEKKPEPKKASKEEEEDEEEDEEDDEDSDEDSDEEDDEDDDDDDLDLDDSDDDEETKALMAKRSEQVKKIQERQAAKKGDAKSNLTLDVKPYDAETDMIALEKEVRAIDLPGIKWLGGALVDVAYGVKKLRIMVQMYDEQCSPDQIREAVEALEDVQSTDVFAFQMA